jgi:F-type H+-transporting ATPase subunit a
MTATPLDQLIAAAPLAAADNPLNHVVDHAIVGWFTNHMLMLFVSAGIMLLIFPKITRRYRSGELVPTGTRNFFEAMLIYVRDDVARPVLAEKADRFMPLLWTMFFFILINNLLGLLPIEPITGGIARTLFGDYDSHGHPRHGIGGTATGNIYVTAALALVSFVVTQASGIRANGLANYLKHFTAGAPLYMAPILVPVEIIGLFVKPFALAIRLFANMVAGHVLLAVLIGFVGLAYVKVGAGGATGVGVIVVAGATAIMCLELFVAFLQAYLFTFLTALFIGQLIVHEHEDHDEHEHVHHGKDDISLGAGDMIGHNLPDAPRQAGAHMAG